MNDSKVEICGVDTNRLELLREEEKLRLIAAARGGDSAARDRLVKGNLRLVLSVIQRFLNRGEPADDLFQVGCIGLMKAIDNFDLTLGVRFSTYAVPMIIGEVRRFMRDSSPMRVSRSMRELAYHAMQCREKLQNELCREPSVGEIARGLGCDEQDVVMALESAVDPVSLYEPLYCERGDTVYVMDQVGSTESEGDWICELSLRAAMHALGERERRILSLRYMKGMTQTQVAQAVGISQAQVSRLEKCALEKIKSQL